MVSQWLKKYKGIVAAVLFLFLYAGISVSADRFINKSAKLFPAQVYAEQFSYYSVEAGQTFAQDFENGISSDRSVDGLRFTASAEQETALAVEVTVGDKVYERQTLSVFEQRDYYFDFGEAVHVQGTAVKIRLTPEHPVALKVADGTSEAFVDNTGIGKTLVSTAVCLSKPQELHFYRLFCVLIAVVLVGSFVLIRFLKGQSVQLIFSMIVLMGFLYMSVFTPHTIPDEPVHYVSAYRYSNVLSFQPSANLSDGVIMMRQDDYDFYNRYQVNLSDDHYRHLAEEESLIAKNTELVNTPLDGIVSRPLAYFPSAVGMSICRLLGLGAVVVYYAGRLFNLLFFALLMAIAVKLIPFGKNFVMTVSLLPMTLHLAASYSYDCYSIGMIFVLFAYLLRMIYGKETVGWKQLAVTAGLIILAVPYKLVYIGVAALVLLVPKKNFAWPKAHMWLKIGLGVIAVASIVICSFGSLEKATDASAVNGTAEGYSLMDVLGNPAHTMMMFGKTLYARGDFYLQSLIGGSLGWLETQTPWVVVIAFVLLLLLSTARHENEPAALTPIGRVYGLLMFLVMVMLTLLILMVDWTPLSSPIVEGVQGRYFIAALPALYLALRGNRVIVNGLQLRHYATAAISLNGIFLLLQLVQIILA